MNNLIGKKGTVTTNLVGQKGKQGKAIIGGKGQPGFSAYYDEPKDMIAKKEHRLHRIQGSLEKKR
jgi:hypothetical protein